MDENSINDTAKNVVSIDFTTISLSLEKEIDLFGMKGNLNFFHARVCLFLGSLLVQLRYFSFSFPSLKMYKVIKIRSFSLLFAGK